MAYKPFNPYPAFDALRRSGPKSNYPGYDEMTEEDPNYPPWSAQRPVPTGVTSSVPTAMLQGPSIDTGDEADLSFLANRDPSSVIPGANEYWGNKLRGIQDTREQGRLAELAGFLSPQEAAGYSRQMGEEKMRQPMAQTQAEVAGRGDVARTTGEYGLAGARLAEEGATARDAALRAIQREQIAANAGSGRSQSYSKGGFSIGAQPRSMNTNPLLTKFAAAIQGNRLEEAAPIGSALFDSDPAPQGLKTALLQILQDPATSQWYDR
jgi:hypothetical protein